MTGTISFGGVGSGMDTEGIVSGLIQAESGTLNALKARVTDTDAAVSTLSNISSLLSTFRSAVNALSDARNVGSYTATSSSSAVAASANGAALPGAYSLEVLALAKEQRSYSQTFSAADQALGQSGTLTLQVGSGTAVNVDITASDTLNDIVTKINGKGGRFSASVFNDGTNYRLQLRGLDTGAANAITISGLDLGMNADGNKVQAAQDSKVKIDGFTVTRSTNQVVGAIQGVTLALTQETTSPVQLRIDSDSSALQTKIQSVVSSYNAVISKIQQTAGYGTTAGNSKVLRGDSTLRSIAQQMSSTVLKQVTTGGTFQNLKDIGISLGRDGTLSLDSTKLSQAIARDSSSVSNVLAGPTGSDGVMDLMTKLADNITASDKGILGLRSDGLSKLSKQLNTRAAAEQDRLNKEAERLRKQFTAMDTTVAGNQAQLSYLQNLYVTK
ncbi:MAG: flagellar filament capping protein FliD [Myxococcota bacterium]